MCAFAVMKNIIPEEAERGDVFVCETQPAATPVQVRMKWRKYQRCEKDAGAVRSRAPVTI